MAKVEIFTTAFCPYCTAAKELLDGKGCAYDETDVTFNPDARKAMAARAGRSSVPQIWIDGKHVGGCDDLHDLDRAGKLDPLLAARDR